MENLKALERLINSLAKLPSVGQKSAERMAYAMLEMKDEDLQEFSDAIKNLKSSIHRCQICGNYTEEEICPICKDNERDKSAIIVVSYPKDVIAIEKAESFNGTYHVLGGVISPSKGKTIEDLNIPNLIARLKDGKVKEVILAMNPNVDGETTALYLARKLEDYNVSITRLAYGLQIGGALDYTDALTLSKALEGRRKI
ncbi:Recombination protein RecR [bioreactor metagenome]|uniref:Recombination protein RecR n=1 Tax=bioreactor metagenome TaxID=1076179 RepID=A0A645CGZ7_9ZZZZ|nr:recombination mediator RecR [Erysipelotrichaceae bacterium]